jgi:hypothetical protein
VHGVALCGVLNILELSHKSVIQLGASRRMQPHGAITLSTTSLGGAEGANLPVPAIFAASAQPVFMRFLGRLLLSMRMLITPQNWRK